MTLRSLATLGVVTVLAVAGAIFTSFSWNTRDAVSERGATLLPDVAKQVGDIATISIKTEDQEITLKRDGEAFAEADSGFPVKQDVVRTLMASVALLNIEEKKTSDATRHAELNLAATDAEKGAGEWVSFGSKNGDEIAAVIAGKTDYTVGGVRGGQYVRRAGEDQTYLVRGSVKLPYGRSGWFETKLLEVKPETVVSAEIAKGTDRQAALTKVGETLKLVDVPEGKAADETKIGQLTRLFGNLTFIDVRKKANTAKADAPAISIATADGLSVKLVSLSVTEDKGHWVQIEAAGETPEAKRALADLAKKLELYEFKVSGSKIAPIEWTSADLTKDAQS